MITAEAAVVRQRNGPFSIETLVVSEPREGEVLVKVVACGLCHTDLIVRDGYRNVDLPVVLGHEGAGIIEAVGPGTTKVAPGDTVIMTFPHCGVCRECLAGRPTNCPHLDQLYHRCSRADGSAPFSRNGERVNGLFAAQSSFASYTIASARSVVKIPPANDLRTLAPLGCGVITGAGAVMNAMDVQAGASLAVFGLGAVGLSAVMAGRVVGCGEIVAIDLSQARRHLALEIGATVVIDPREIDPVIETRRLSDGGVQWCVEATGRPPVLLQAVRCLAGGGTCVFVGNHPEGSRLELEIGLLEFNQSLKGCVLGNCVPDVFITTLLALHKQGRFPIDRLVRLYPLADLNDAVADALGGDTVKPVLVMPH